MSSIAEELSRFTSSVGDTINVTFKSIADFIDTVITFFTTLGFWSAVLVFFLFFTVLFGFPMFIFRYWKDIKENFVSLTNNIVSSMSKR